MKQSTLFLPTKKYVKDDVSKSQAIAEKGGFASQSSAGVCNLLHMGFKLKQNIERLVFEELESMGCTHLELAVLQSKEVWDRTGRWEKYLQTKTMFLTESSSGAMYGISPTAEEECVAAVENHIQSYRDLPKVVGQIGVKFRDEIRTRAFLTRGRQFSMQDHYAFCANQEQLNDIHKKIEQAYLNIFKRVGLLDIRMVEADSGAIGGSGGSTEFMYISDELGEDYIMHCSNSACGYAANVEKAVSDYPKSVHESELLKSSKELTPNIKSIEDLVKHFKVSASKILKTVLVVSDPGTDRAQAVGIVIRGDLDVNLTKVANMLSATDIVAAEESVIESITGCKVGFAGPVGADYPIYFDESTSDVSNFVVGCNETDYHIMNGSFDIDIPRPARFYDLYEAQEGHQCKRCESGVMQKSKGSELAHSFDLGTTYSKAMDLDFVAEDGSRQWVKMGCYGLGISRMLQIVLDAHCVDDSTLILPFEIAPYQVHVLMTGDSQEQKVIAGLLEASLKEIGVSVLIDERDKSMGVKFRDSDLLGSPLRIIVGRNASEGVVEYLDRLIGESIDLSVDEVISKVAALR